MGIVGVVRRHAAQHLRQPVAVVIVGVGDRVSITARADFAGQLIGHIVAEGGHRAIGICPAGDIAGGIVAIAVVGLHGQIALPVPDVGGTVGVVVDIAGQGTVAIGQAGQAIGVIVAIGGRLAVGIGDRQQPIRIVIGIRPVAGSGQGHLCLTVGIIVGIAGRTVGSGDLGELVGIIVSVAGRAGAVGHASQTTGIVVAEAGVGFGRVVYECLPAGIVVAVENLLSLTICVRRFISVGIICPAFRGTVRVAGTGDLVP